MKSLKLLAALAIFVGIAGCDTTAFTDDFPDPGTEGLPPYVAFDVAQLTTAGWVYTATADEQGARRSIAHPGTAGVATALTGLRPRLPAAIGEDVTVTFEVTGSAVRGTDYRIEHFDVEAAGCQAPWTMAACWVVNTGNQVTIRFFDENPDAANQAPHYRDLRIVTLQNAASTSARTVQIKLTGATATETGRPIDIGRFPDNRDEIATLSIAPPVALTGVTIVCPAELEVDEDGEFRVSALAPAGPTGPFSYAWDFGDGSTATGATVEHAFDEADTYVVTLTATGFLNQVQATCEVEVVEPEDDDDDDDDD